MLDNSDVDVEETEVFTDFARHDIDLSHLELLKKPLCVDMSERAAAREKISALIPDTQQRIALDYLSMLDLVGIDEQLNELIAQTLKSGPGLQREKLKHMLHELSTELEVSMSACVQISNVHDVIVRNASESDTAYRLPYAFNRELLAYASLRLWPSVFATKTAARRFAMRVELTCGVIDQPAPIDDLTCSHSQESIRFMVFATWLILRSRDDLAGHVSARIYDDYVHAASAMNANVSPYSRYIVNAVLFKLCRLESHLVCIKIVASRDRHHVSDKSTHVVAARDLVDMGRVTLPLADASSREFVKILTRVKPDSVVKCYDRNKDKIDELCNDIMSLGQRV